MNFDQVIDRRNTGSVKWDYAPGPLDPEQEVIPLSVADMEFRSPACIRQRLKEVAEEGIWGYTGPRDQYYAAVNRWYSDRHGFPVDKDWLVPTTGVVQAVFSAVRAFSEPGDKILIQTPVYHPFYRAVLENKRPLLTTPLLIREGRYQIDFEDFENKMSQAKLFILCSPHNPIGRVWEREELDQMARIAAKHQVFVISDEIHCDFTFGSKHTVFSEVARLHQIPHLIAFSASKTFSLAGLCLASIVVEEADHRDRFRKQARIDGVHTHSTFGFAAAEVAYTQCDDCYQAMLSYVYENYLELKAFVRQEMPDVTVFDLEGTYLAWLGFSSVCGDHEELERCMIDQCLYLDEGHIFGREGQGFERINLACPRRVLLAALKRLKIVYDLLKEGQKG